MEKQKTCPVEDTIQFLGQKWTMLILRQIQILKIARFNQLIENLNTISPKTLSKRLKELEENEFIIKKKYNQIPPKVEYKLTKKGEEFALFFENFHEIIKKHN